MTDQPTTTKANEEQVGENYNIESSSKINYDQVGGSHYKASYAHWDWVEDTGMGYLEGYATKYVFRWRDKDGLEGLKKAAHCIRKLMEKYETITRRNRATNRNDLLTQKMATHKFAQTSMEMSIFYAALHWETKIDLDIIHECIECLIQEAINNA